MKKLEYLQVGCAEMSPDIYGGEDCNEHIAQWKAYFDGDKDSGFVDVIKLDSAHFPAGTRIVVSMPMCPDCNETQETCQCGFDWMEWIEDNYA